MKKIKLMGNVIFLLTLVSPLLSFALASEIGEANIFGIAGIVRYSWIMWLFIPFGVASIVLGKVLKSNGQPYKKHYIVAFVCLPLLIFFGSYRCMFRNMTYDASDISAIEATTGIDLPDNRKSATTHGDAFTLSYVKLNDKEEATAFQKELQMGDVWTSDLDPDIKGMLPTSVQTEMRHFDSFVFYNLSTEEYNTRPSGGECVCICMAYDNETQRCIILSDYVVRLN